MSTILNASPVRVGRPRRPNVSKTPEVRRAAGVVVATICASGLYLFTCTPEEYEVGLPIVVMAMTAVLFWCVLWIRERDIPFFEIGSFFMLAAAVCSVT